MIYINIRISYKDLYENIGMSLRTLPLPPRLAKLVFAKAQMFSEMLPSSLAAEVGV